MFDANMEEDDKPEHKTSPLPCREGLMKALTSLNEFLAHAVKDADESFGPHAALDGLRGLHISSDDIQRTLKQQQGNIFGNGATQELVKHLKTDTAFNWLIKTCQLSNEEILALFFTLAPEIDTRYEKLYAYLQDDVTCRRPSLGLLQNLIAKNREERFAILDLISNRSALISQNLINVHGETKLTLPHWSISIDPQIARFLLGTFGCEPRLRSWCQQLSVNAPAIQALPVHQDVRSALLSAVATQTKGGIPIRLYLQGPAGSGKRLAASAIASILQIPILAVDLRGAQDFDEGFDEALRILLREAWLTGSMLLFDGLDGLQNPSFQQDLDRLSVKLAQCTVPIVILGNLPWPPLAGPPLGFRTLLFKSLDIATREKIWQTELSARQLEVPDGVCRALARLFKITPAQIAEAVVSARAFSPNWEPNKASTNLAAQVRAQCGHALSKLSKHVAPRASFNDLILPVETLSQLRELHTRMNTREAVYHHWGKRSIHARIAGVTALFGGPSGTGKTLAAEALARELGLDLYQIDLASIVSKYIGETEKNLDRVFTAAENANAVLFFDEAEALFGKRSEVNNAHDRYANIEVAYLLQKMEQFDGLAILATNLKQNLDDAFVRRLAFSINFPFPETSERERLWEALWLPGIQRTEDINLTWFAHEFRLSGGSIRNAVIAATHLAVSENNIVTREILLHAVNREFQKHGKNLNASREIAA